MVALTVVRMVSETWLARVGEAAALKLRSDLMAAVECAPLRDLEKIGASKIRNVAGSDCSAMALGVASLPFIVMNACVVVGVLVLIFQLNWRTGLVFMAGLAIGMFLFRIIQKHVMDRFRSVRKDLDAVDRILSTQLHSIASLKLNSRRHRHVISDALSGWGRVRENLVEGRLYSSLHSNLVSLIIFSGILAVIFFRDGLGLNTAALAQFGFLAIFFINPVGNLMLRMQPVAGAFVAHERYASMATVLTKQELAVDAEETLTVRREVELRAVRYSYEHFELGPVDMRVRPGECLFIVGGNGSGKSTLLKVLMGVYEPSGGSILYDGRKVDFGSNAYRELFAYVPFDFALFGMLYGRDVASEQEAVQRHLDAFGLDGKVALGADGRWSTTQLSQGQRRRLALIDAITESKPILVLDECAADQDPASRDAFYRVLLPRLLAEGRTLVVVSHDDRFFDVADSIVKLEHGRQVAPSAAQRRRMPPPPPPPLSRSLSVDAGER